MLSSTKRKYTGVGTEEPLPTECLLNEDCSFELEDGKYVQFREQQSGWAKGMGANQYLAILNITMTILLAISLAVTFKSGQVSKTTHRPEPPWTPITTDWENRKFKPTKIFQTEVNHDNFEQVEKAWRDIQGETAGVVDLPVSMAAKLPHKSVENSYHPGFSLYGVSVYHQLHCLDTIRRFFYPEVFFPDMEAEDIIFHKNHCFDFLRQVITCTGDLNMVYWWNKNFTTTAEDGTETDSKWYLSLNGTERMKHSIVKWDVQHQCRNFDQIEAWVGQNAAFVLPEKGNIAHHDHGKLYGDKGGFAKHVPNQKMGIPW